MKYLYLKFFQSRNHNYMKRRIYLIYIFLIMAVACNSVGREYERLAGSRITFPNSLQRVEGCDTKYKSYCDIYLPCSDFGY